MKITVARTAGPCFGVQRALELAQQSAALGPTCTLGELIHNRQAVQQLSESGITVIASPEEAPAVIPIKRAPRRVSRWRSSWSAVSTCTVGQYLPHSAAKAVVLAL